MATLHLSHALVETRAIGLDVDGVLRDTAYVAYQALCKTVDELGGIAPAFDAFVQGYESDYRTYYRSCGVQDVERIYPVYSRYVGAPDSVPPFPDVADFLSHLQDHDVKVFVVSSHPTEQLHSWFAAHGIDDHMLCVFGGSRDKRDCIRGALASVDIPSFAACYVGDWGLDMRAAKAVGLTPIGITRGYPSKTGLLASGAAHVVEHLHELVEMIR